jgi:hypothetical protein
MHREGDIDCRDHGARHRAASLSGPAVALFAMIPATIDEIRCPQAVRECALGEIAMLMMQIPQVCYDVTLECVPIELDK